MNKRMRATLLVVLFTATTVWLGWQRFGPASPDSFSGMSYSASAPLSVKYPNTRACDLKVNAFKQVGSEIQVQLYSSQARLSPYRVKISQKSRILTRSAIPNRPDTWLVISDLDLESGPFTIQITSQNRADCTTEAVLNYDARPVTRVLDPKWWIRQGSQDQWLDVRPVVQEGKLLIKDFADYNDGRTRVYFIDGVAVGDLASGLRVRPGYLYSVTTKWIDGPYNDWWNPLRNRSVRQQNLWIDALPEFQPRAMDVLRPIPFPKWFRPSSTHNVYFDSIFPEFEPIQNKFSIQFRLNESIPPEYYLKRGITHLPRFERIPSHRSYWTETANFWHDNETAWFEKLSIQEVQNYARRLAPVGVYGLDFELWHNNYTPKVKERLIAFVKTLRQDNKVSYLFDYWGGPAYRSPNFGHSIKHTYKEYLGAYANPKPNHPNFEPTASGESFSDYINLAAIDVYPKLLFPTDMDGNTPNNYMLLSAIHAIRINQRIDFQKKMPVLLFLWNRHQPQFKDPIVPISHRTTNPSGELILYGLETMPASQAYAYVLFAMLIGDGYILWHDDSPKGNNPNHLSADRLIGDNWFPYDGKTSIDLLLENARPPYFPTYWDYPTEFSALANWTAKQLEPYLTSGNKPVDLDFQTGGRWVKAQEGQAVLAAAYKYPFVTSIQNGSRMLLVAVDSFQPPTAVKRLPIRLPAGKVVYVELIGNWPTICEVSI